MGSCPDLPRCVKCLAPAPWPGFSHHGLLTLAPPHPAPTPTCSLPHVRRLLAAAGRLPVEMRIQLGLHARSEPASDWHTKLLTLQRALEAQQAQQAGQRQALQQRQAHSASAKRAVQHKAPACKGDAAHMLVPARRLQHSS